MNTNYCPGNIEATGHAIMDEADSVLVFRKLMQAPLILLCLTVTAVFKLKVCDNPAWSKSICTIFPIPFAHFLSLCHIRQSTILCIKLGLEIHNIKKRTTSKYRSNLSLSS